MPKRQNSMLKDEIKRKIKKATSKLKEYLRNPPLDFQKCGILKNPPPSRRIQFLITPLKTDRIFKKPHLSSLTVKVFD